MNKQNWTLVFPVLLVLAFVVNSCSQKSGSPSPKVSVSSNAASADNVKHPQPFLPDPNQSAIPLNERSNIRVAVIGGGTSGMLAAWNMRRLGYAVTLYEKSHRLGGNVDTKQISIDCLSQTCLCTDGNNCPKKIYTRWADLGVNDFNTKTYHYLVWLLDQLAVANPQGTPQLPSGRHTFYSDLINNATFLTYSGQKHPDEQYVPDCDVEPSEGNCNQYQILGDREKAPKYPPPKRLKEDIDKFFKVAPRVMNIRDPCYEATVNDYFFGNTKEPACYKKQDVEYNDVISLANKAVKPRINNMYFVNGTDPGSLLLRAVMNYYYLQEGLLPGETAHPHRVFFVKGASSWINALEDALSCNVDCNKYYFDHTYPNLNPDFLPTKDPVLIYLDHQIQRVAWDQNSRKFTVSTSTGSWEHDIVILTVPAYVYNTNNKQPHDVGNHIDVTGLFPREFYTQVQQVKYFADYGFAHTDWKYIVKTQGQLDALNTYNVFIPDYLKPPQTLQPEAVPYTISYVENDHQNDAANYDIPQPVFFVSEGPLESLPVQERPCNPPGEDSNTCVTLTDGKPDPVKAEVFLQHQVLDQAMMTLQGTISGLNTHEDPGLQGHNGIPIYFAGGWVKGAGLQEQCFRQAVQVAYEIEWPDAFLNIETFFDDTVPPGGQGRPSVWLGYGAGVHPNMFSVSPKK